MRGKRVVYTALFGAYEELSRTPLVGVETELPMICFTDDPELTSDVWEIRLIEPTLESDPVRAARMLKIRGHESLDEYDTSLWIDNTVALRQSPEQLLDAWLADADIALPVHSFRESVLAEFDTVARHGLDDAARVYEQLIHYSRSHPDVLEQRPYWTALIARSHTPEVKATMITWSDQVLRYSRRDQLSVNVALAASSARVAGVELDNHLSEFHEWPTAETRQSRVTLPSAASALRPPVTEMGYLQNMVDELTAENHRLNARIDTITRRNAESAEELANRAEQLAKRAEELAQHADALGRRNEELTSSSSWRITAGFRWLAAKLHPRR